MEFEETSKRKRPWLVYLPTDGGDVVPQIFTEGRAFDIAVNIYTDREFKEDVEWMFNISGLKYRGFNAALEGILLAGYEYIAIIDDDIEIDAEQVNRLFKIGITLDLSLWQPCHLEGSHNAHGHLAQSSGSFVRKTDFVECMCPFFSRNALLKIKPYFKLSESGWGLDYIWPKVLADERIAIIDCEGIRHVRPVRSQFFQSSEGRNACDELGRIWDLMRSGELDAAAGIEV